MQGRRRKPEQVGQEEEPHMFEVPAWGQAGRSSGQAEEEEEGEEGRSSGLAGEEEVGGRAVGRGQRRTASGEDHS